MIQQLAKGVAAAAMLGTVALKDVALYVGIVSTLSGVAVIGAIWAAARAWRERAEARDDEASEARRELKDAREKMAALEATVDELRRRGDVEAAARQLRLEHKQIVAALGEQTKAIAAVQTAVEFMFKQTFPTAVTPLRAAGSEEGAS